MDSKRIIADRSANEHWTKHAARLPIRFEYQNTEVVPVNFEMLKQNRIVATMEPDTYTNAYKILRTQLLNTLRDNRWNTLAITSPRNGEGKTLTAINLAISMAMEVNNTVLLVDANLRNPKIHELFGFNQQPGLSDYLCNNTSLDSLFIHPSGIDRFVILPSGRSLNNAGEMLSSHTMIQFVKEVRERYLSRIVIFDLPPVMVAGEALAIAPYMDAIVLVAEAGKTRKQDLSHTEELLASSNVIGTVLTKARESSWHT